MTPSPELRNMAAELHEAMTKAEDVIREAVDNGATAMDLAALWTGNKWPEFYEIHCVRHGFRLMTDASGLFLRCAETGIPLVVGDDTSDLGDGEFILVKQAA